MSAVSKQGSSSAASISLFLPLTIPAPVTSILISIRASTATVRVGLGLRWPALRGDVRTTSPRPSGGIPRDHPTGGRVAAGGDPMAEGTTTMHTSMHYQRAPVPLRGGIAVSFPKAQPEGRATP